MQTSRVVALEQYQRMQDAITVRVSRSTIACMISKIEGTIGGIKDHMEIAQMTYEDRRDSEDAFERGLSAGIYIERQKLLATYQRHMEFLERQKQELLTLLGGSGEQFHR